MTEAPSPINVVLALFRASLGLTSERPIAPHIDSFNPVVLFQEAQMLTKKDADEFANHWVKAWNSHDLDEIMLHYSTDIVLVSPVAAKILSDPSGVVKGKEALRAYFRRGLEAYPNLKFELVDVMCGISSIVLYYVNQKGTKTGELMEMDADVRVTRVVANYSD